MAKGGNAQPGSAKGRRLGTVDVPPERPGGEVKPLPPMGVSVVVLAAVAALVVVLFLFCFSRDLAAAGWLSLIAGVVTLYVLPRYLPGLRERTALQRARHDGVRLVKVVRKASAKQKEWTGDNVRQKLEDACQTVERALPSRDLAAIEFATKKLDELASQHLTRKAAAREIVEQLGGAIALALIIRAFFYEAYQIPSASMVPTLVVGDHLFVNKFVYGFDIPFTTKKLFASLPKRGDIVVFKDPRDPSADAIIKRVIGLPGDKVIVRDRKVTLCPGGGDCEPLWTKAAGEVRLNEDGDSSADTQKGPFRSYRQFEEKIGAHDHLAQAMENGLVGPDGEWTVQPDHVFMMGDNRDNSEDSRFSLADGGFGEVPVDYLKGRADIIWLSLGGPHGLRFSRLFKLLP